MKSQCKLTCNWLFIYFLVGRTPYSEMKRSEIELQVQTDAAKTFSLPLGIISSSAAKQPIPHHQKQHCEYHAPNKIRKQHHDKHTERHPKQCKPQYSLHSVTSEKSVISLYASDCSLMPHHPSQEYPLRLFLSSSRPFPKNGPLHPVSYPGSL